MLKKLQQKGQGLVEYALILVLVAIVIIVILSVLGPAIGNVFSQIVKTI
jgi:pilus assembly protein Flp/PilA